MALILPSCFSKVKSMPVSPFTPPGCLGIPFVCKSTYLTKLKATQRAYARRAERGTPTDATADTPTASPTNGASDAELLSKNMTGFSEVMW